MLLPATHRINNQGEWKIFRISNENAIWEAPTHAKEMQLASIIAIEAGTVP